MVQMQWKTSLLIFSRILNPHFCIVRGTPSLLFNTRINAYLPCRRGTDDVEDVGSARLAGDAGDVGWTCGDAENDADDVDGLV